ncbi:response regulator transcription factor [Oscillospiraceae bacterium OttesenSCG-928-G22]|nr:response regulator transcription factor [Oscillospiraceae bacterium OttesenSCG-928-G22]
MRILIIEDDRSIAELVRDYLEISGFACDIEMDGERGLQRALTEDYALIVVDIMLPSRDGFDICARVREKKETPLLILSARKEDIDKVRGLGLGADDYMTKPFSPNELVARVKTHIDRFDRLTGRKGRGSLLQVRGLSIDRDARKVFIDGQEKLFPAKEYELLLFLAENPNRVFSKDHLFDRIWGLDALGDVATVTVHIQRIREKIELDSGNPQYIETVWGAGYRFKG